MDILTRGLTRLWQVVLIGALVTTPGSAHAQIDASFDSALKAAFLFNFVKFTEWPPLPSAVPLRVCVAGDDRVARDLSATVRGHQVRNRPLEVEVVDIRGHVQPCHVLFVGRSEARRAKPVLDGLKMLPILTVGDGAEFAHSDGIIGFYIEGERMRFSINPGAADRAGLRLSSRLLGLAQIVSDGHGS